MATRKKAKPVKSAKKKPVIRTWNAAEALTAFFGFITTREKELIIGSHYDCSPLATLTNEFMKVNKLKPVRVVPDWVAPIGFDDVTNVPPPVMKECSVNKEPLTAEQAAREMIDKIDNMPTNQQDAALATFLGKLVDQRKKKLERMELLAKDVQGDMEAALDSISSISSILSGNFSVIKSQ